MPSTWSMPLVLAALLIGSGGQAEEAIGSADKHAESESVADAKAAIAKLSEFVHKAEKHLTEGSKAVVQDIMDKVRDDFRERRSPLHHEWVLRLHALNPAELACGNSTTIQDAIDAVELAEEDLRRLDSKECEAVLDASKESCVQAKERVLELGKEAKQSLDNAKNFAKRAALRELASGVPKSTIELEKWQSEMAGKNPWSLEWEARQVTQRAERFVDDGCRQVKEQLHDYVELLEHEATREHKERQTSLHEARGALAKAGIPLPELLVEAPGKDAPSFSWLTSEQSWNLASLSAVPLWGFIVLPALGALLGWAGYTGAERTRSIVERPASLAQPAALG